MDTPKLQPLSTKPLSSLKRTNSTTTRSKSEQRSAGSSSGVLRTETPPAHSANEFGNDRYQDTFRKTQYSLIRNWSYPNSDKNQCYNNYNNFNSHFNDNNYHNQSRYFEDYQSIDRPYQPEQFPQNRNSNYWRRFDPNDYQNYNLNKRTNESRTHPETATRRGRLSGQKRRCKSEDVTPSPTKRKASEAIVQKSCKNVNKSKSNQTPKKSHKSRKKCATPKKRNKNLNENKKNQSPKRENSKNIKKESSDNCEIHTPAKSPKITVDSTQSTNSTENLDKNEQAAITAPETDTKHLDETSEASPIKHQQIDNNARSPVKVESAPATTPKISIIPLSRLIRFELLDLTSDGVEPAISAPTTPQKRICRPNLIKRNRKISTGSNSSSCDTLVEKIVNMDKEGIKNVINNPGTKYDEVLKLQARKRLREEIRKQLKSMNVEPTKDTAQFNFTPDDIVDSIHIPDVLLDEIRKAFGIEIIGGNQSVQQAEKTFDDRPNMDVRRVAAEIYNLDSVENSNTAPPDNMPIDELLNIPLPSDAERRKMLTTLNRIEGTNVQSPMIQDQEVTSFDTHLKNANDTPSNTEHPVSTLRRDAPLSTNQDLETTREVLPTPRKSTSCSPIKVEHSPSPARDNTTPNRIGKTSKDVILIDTSSSSSSASSSSSSSSSDSDSESSKNSGTSSVRRRRLKLRVDAQNVVDSFEKLILPSLSESLTTRYRIKFSNSTYTKLHFISCICTSEYNSRKFTKAEIAKIQSNLKSEDRMMALEFLLREIVNVFNKQKEEAKKQRGSKRSKSPDLMKPQTNKHLSNETAKHETDNASLEVDNAIPAAVRAAAAAIRAKSANAAKKCSDVAVRRERGKKRKSNDKQSKPPDKQQCDAYEETAINNDGEGNGGGAGVGRASTATSKIINPISLSPSRTEHGSCNTLKKHKQEPEHSTLGKSLAMFRKEIIATSAEAVESAKYAEPSTQGPQADGAIDNKLEVKDFQSIVSDVVANNLHNIDNQLLDLNRRKMFIEEMILKLQKEKMDVDMQVLKLQNEKFMLLNTSMTAAVTAKESKKTPPPPPPCTNSEKLNVLLTVSNDTKPIAEATDYSRLTENSVDNLSTILTQVCVIQEFIIAAGEDGHLYKFDIWSLKLLECAEKHNEAIVKMHVCKDKKIVYSISQKGWLNGTSLENFKRNTITKNFNESLSCMDVTGITVYIGSKKGSIFRYEKNSVFKSWQCSSKSAILALKAFCKDLQTLLLVSTANGSVLIYDITGTEKLLSLIEVPCALGVHHMLVEKDFVYYATQWEGIYKYDYMTGELLSKLKCIYSPKGVKTFMNKYILVSCDDNYVYIFDEADDRLVGRCALNAEAIAFDLAGSKIITATKSKALHIIDMASNLESIES